MGVRDWWKSIGPIHESYLAMMIYGGIAAGSLHAGPDLYGTWWKNMLADLPAAAFLALLGVVIASKLTEKHFELPDNTTSPTGDSE